MSTRENGALIMVSETAQATMMAAARHAHPNETGGILIGVHVDGHPWVTIAIEVTTSDRGRGHYRIPGGATQPAVRASRRTDRRLGYLGDWHSHPSDVGPSPMDLASLGLISMKHPRTPNPTLILVRNTVDGYALDARRIVAIVPRACEVRLTGDLPLEPAPTEHDTSDLPAPDSK